MPFTRAVFLVGVCLTIGTGIGLFAVPGHTSEYWAWTIKAPLTAAFFGAGYIGAAVALAWAAATREWQRTRIVVVIALTLTSLALLETLRHLGGFSLHQGGLVEIVAWVWLAVYVALPPLALAAFVLQERAGGSAEYTLDRPALAATRLAAGTLGAVTAVVGGILLWEAAWLQARWPWPLPSLPATITGAWLCTLAAGLLWFALRERTWYRGRIAVIPMLIPLGLDLVAAARLSGGFRGTTATSVYLAAVALSTTVVATIVIVEERRLASS